MSLTISCPKGLSYSRRPVITLLVAGVMSGFLHGCESGDSASSNGTLDLFPRQIGSWMRGDSARVYDRQTIFEYTENAAVYNSYAFERVTIATYSNPAGTAASVELFDMGTPSDAYGVFSFAREQEDSGIGGGYDLRDGVLCFWQNRFYARVASEQEATESSQMLIEIARAISARLPDPSELPNLVQLLPSEGLVQFSQRFFHLHQTLNHHYYLGRENLLRLNVGTNAVLARYRPGETYLLTVSYENEAAAADAWLSFRQGYLRDVEPSRAVASGDGKFVSLRTQSRFVVVVLDGESAVQADRLAQAAVDKLDKSLDWGA